MKKHLLFLLFIFNSHLYAAAYIQHVDVKRQNNKTLIQFTLNKAAAHKAFILANPNRVVVDFSHAKSTFKLEELALDKSIFMDARSGYYKPSVLRFVFHTKNNVRVDDVAVKRHFKNQPIYTVELYHHHNRDAMHANSKKGISSRHVGAKSIKKADRVKNSPAKSLRDVVVVIDPGHGGKDPGAIGTRRTKEKNITLAIAQALKKIIDQQSGMRAVLTRKGDYYIGLRNRLKIAREHDADVFVSIHADAFVHRHSNGASVFALSERGATSEAARWLAEKENYSELGGVDLTELDDDNGIVRTVLIDLSQTATISASLKMGERVLRHLDKMTTLHKGQVEQARFMVLKSPDIPSILVETGFISNPREEKKLNSVFYQTKLARAVFRGVKAFFLEYPPPETWIEAMSNSKRFHLVKKGESLSVIARKYHVPLRQLMTFNRLNGSTIHIGQRLLIPT